MIMSWGGYWQFNSAGFRWASLTSLVWSQAIPAVVWKRFSTWAVVVHHGLDRPDTAPDSWIRGWCEIYVRFMWFWWSPKPTKKNNKIGINQRQYVASFINQWCRIRSIQFLDSNLFSLLETARFFLAAVYSPACFRHALVAAGHAGLIIPGPDAPNFHWFGHTMHAN